MRDRTVAADVTVPLAAGALGAGIVGLPWRAVALAIGALALAPACRTRWRCRLVAAAAGAAMAALGLVVAAAPLPSDHVAWHASNGRTAIEGSVAATEAAGSRRRLIVRAERIRVAAGWVPVRGRVGVTIAHPERAWPVGASVRVVARLRRPRNFGNPGGYDYVGSLARRRVFVTAFVWDDASLTLLAPPGPGLSWMLHRVRERLREGVLRVADPDARAFLLAVLLGERGALDSDRRRVLARVGVAHIAAVSGFHVAVVAGAGVLLAGWVVRKSAWMLRRWDGGKIALLGGLPLVLLYSAVAGGHVPATRALLMYLVVCGARWIDRPADAIRALAAIACVVVMPTPARAADVSFALSFASVLAIVVALRRRGRAPADSRRCRVMRALVTEPLRVTVAAWIATAPLMAWYFQEVSLIAPVANLLTLPFLGPGTLVPGLLALPFVAIAPHVADLLLGCAAVSVRVGLECATWLATLPLAAVSTPRPSVIEITIAYAAMALWLARGGGASRSGQSRRYAAGFDSGAAESGASGGPDSGEDRIWSRRRVRAWLMLAVALVAVGDVSYWVVERQLSGRLRVTFLSVGQGDAAVVELPYGRVMVVDGGGLPGPFDPGERIIGPFLRARKIGRIDVVALSHPQHDHYEGLAYLVEEFRAREFWSSGARSSSAGFARLEAALARAGTRRRLLRTGDVPLDADGVRVEVLSPPAASVGLSTNDASLVLRIVHQRASVLLAGDMEARGEAFLLARGLAASTVLKVAHHGSATSTSAAFLRAVAPRVAVVSAGYGNRFGFPAPAVLARLAAAGARVWRTDRDGAVRVESDGWRVVTHGWRVPAQAVPTRP